MSANYKTKNNFAVKHSQRMPFRLLTRENMPAFAIRLLLVLNTMVLLFHFGIILKIIPYTIAWSGRLENDREMYAFEAVSILINLFFSFILLIKGRMIPAILPLKIVNILLWIFLVIYSLNTVGNLVAVTVFEKYFAILTFIFAVLIGIVLGDKGQEDGQL